MVWISLFLVMTHALGAELPRFLTKHSPETLRYISMDGRYAYVTKKPGVLGLVSSFRSTDFLSESNNNNFIVKATASRGRVVIESIPNSHTEMSLLKNHKIFVVDFGNTVTREVGIGKGAKLHLKDEWITYYDVVERMLHIQNLVTQKKYDIRLSRKANPFFVPEALMISSQTILYTDINESGFSALVSYDLQTQKSNIVYKSTQSATQLELCKNAEYVVFGEFPYDGVVRGSKINTIKLTDSTNLSGFSTIYSSVEQDIGNMICMEKDIYFVKTINQDKVLNYKVTEAVKLNIKSKDLTIKTDLKHVSQLVEMDGRVIIPLRGEFIILEGRANLSEDILKPVPSREELKIDI
jgi:hypothetical protein